MSRPLASVRIDVDRSIFVRPGSACRVWAMATMVLWGVAASAVSQAADFDGSGSTFVYPVLLRWASAYNAKTGVKVNYQAVGSGVGIQQVRAGRVVFGATDKPLSPEELKAAGLAQFPLVIGGVVPVFNIDGIKGGQLKLTGEMLANIYLGTITSWNDPALGALNPELKLPALKITVTHRFDSSGTTFNWTHYLSKSNAEWKAKVGEGTTLPWPLGVGGSGNEGVARYVNYIKGSIGYVELAFAQQHKMAIALLRNQSGEFVSPSSASFEAAASSANWTAPDFSDLLTDMTGKASWPITATTYVLMPRRSKDFERSAEALKFFGWVLEHGQADAKSLDYVPLPDALVRQIETSWAENFR